MSKRPLCFLFLFILPVFYSSAQQYIPYRRGNLWGLVERGIGNGVVSPKYTSMKPLGNGYFDASQKGSSFIIIDSTGKETISLPYAEARFTGDGLLCYTDKKNGDTWYHVSGRKLDMDKREVKEADFSSDGRLGYKNHAGKEGYLDVYGTMAIKAVYDYASIFFNGYAIVGIKDKFGAIDSTGNIIIPLQYESVRPLGSDRFVVYRNHKAALADKTHRLLTPFLFKYIDDFEDGVACVTVPGLRRYINEQGKYLWPKGFKKMALGFENDIAIVNDGSNYMLINKKGEVVYNVPARYKVMAGFKGTFFILKDVNAEEYMVTDRTGKALFTGMNRLPYYATRSYCIVVKDGYYGTINEAGTVVIPVIYDRIEYAKEIDAWYVEENGKPGYIDQQGTKYWIGN